MEGIVHRVEDLGITTRGSKGKGEYRVVVHIKMRPPAK